MYATLCIFLRAHVLKFVFETMTKFFMQAVLFGKHGTNIAVHKFPFGTSVQNFFSKAFCVLVEICVLYLCEFTLKDNNTSDENYR